MQTLIDTLAANARELALDPHLNAYVALCAFASLFLFALSAYISVKRHAQGGATSAGEGAAELETASMPLSAPAVN